MQQKLRVAQTCQRSQLDGVIDKQVFVNLGAVEPWKFPFSSRFAKRNLSCYVTVSLSRNRQFVELCCKSHTRRQQDPVEL